MSQDSTTVIRRATPEDLPGLLEFVGETYGAGAEFKNLARHQWQYEQTPYRPGNEQDPTIWLAFDGPHVVGSIAVQDGLLWIDNATHPASWIVDVMVHPDYRGKRLGHLIHDAVKAERDILVTLTMAVATRRIAERAGCVTLGPTQQFILPHRLTAPTVARFLRHKAHFGGKGRATLVRLFNTSGLGPWAVAMLGRLMSKASRRRAPKDALTGYTIKEVPSFPDDIDTLWETSRSQFGATFERSSQFLNWRFVECPGLSYRRFLAYRDGALTGYVILRVGDKAELPLGVIADMFASPGDPATLDALLAFAIETLGPDADYIEAAASHPVWATALERAGFKATKTVNATVVVADPALREHMAQNPDEWHFTKADHDWDQVHPM